MGQKHSVGTRPLSPPETTDRGARQNALNHKHPIGRARGELEGQDTPLEEIPAATYLACMYRLKLLM